MTNVAQSLGRIVVSSFDHANLHNYSRYWKSKSAQLWPAKWSPQMCVGGRWKTGGLMETISLIPRTFSPLSWTKETVYCSWQHLHILFTARPIHCTSYSELHAQWQPLYLKPPLTTNVKLSPANLQILCTKLTYMNTVHVVLIDLSITW